MLDTHRKVRNIPSVKQGLDERESRERICYRLWKPDSRYMYTPYYGEVRYCYTAKSGFGPGTVYPRKVWQLSERWNVVTLRVPLPLIGPAQFQHGTNMKTSPSV